MADLNPQIRTVGIGTRTLREIVIYPLSMADQIRLFDKMAESVKSYEGSETDSELDSFEAIMSLIRDNLITILEFVTEEKVTLDDLTNEQFASLCEIVYEMNFEGAAKKLKSLFERVQSVLPLKRLSQNSSSVQVTDMSISSSEATEKEE